MFFLLTLLRISFDFNSVQLCDSLVILIMSGFSKFAQSLISNKFIKVGAPFLLFMIGGSFVLQQMTVVRYEVSQHNRTLGLTDKEITPRIWPGKKAEPVKTIVDEYNEMKENLDIDSWTNIRGPRPWEKDEQKYLDIIQTRIDESEQKKKKVGSFWAG